MKKYLMTGITALAMCIGFTSCSHDMTPMSQEEINAAKAQQIVDKYNTAFIAKFGKPASNQDWGFGNTSASARNFTRAGGKYATKGNLTVTGFTFPEDCAATEFNPDLDDVKSYKEIADAANQGGGFGFGICYIDETHVGMIHIWGEWGKRVKLYFKAGTYDFTNVKFDLCADADLYLLSGATLTLGDDAANTAKFDVYIAPGAKLIANGENGYRADVDAHVYNHGTIECTRFEVNGTSFLYNVGTLNSSGNVYIANSTSRIVNDGTVEAASTNVEGSGAVQNNAEWTVTGNTIVNCTNGGWVNNGYWKTQNYHYTAGSNNVINNCFLEVTNEFNINMSSASSDNGFRIDTGGGVLTKNFNGGKCAQEVNPSAVKDEFSGPYKVIMGHSAVFKVTGTATLDGGNKGWGFYGPSDGDYAVFQAKDVVRVAGLENNQGAVTYGGNLYVSAETHFAQGNDGNPNNLFIYEEGDFKVDYNIYAAGFKPGKPGVTIQQTTCCPGFEGTDEDEFDVRIIGEDLTPGDTDWDFNDVVFGVKYNSAGTGATCTLLAAGGTLPLRIAKSGNANLADAADWVEVHALFGVPTTTMVNTGGISTTIDAKPTFDVTGISKSTNGKDIKIYVNKGTEEEPNWIELKAEQGEPAAKLAVKKGFRLCTERQNINGIYKRFDDWVSNPLIRWY